MKKLAVSILALLLTGKVYAADVDTIQIYEPTECFLKKCHAQPTDPSISEGSEYLKAKKFNESLKSFKERAMLGDAQAQQFIGYIYEQNKMHVLAAKWYMLAFQNNWFENPTTASLGALEKLAVADPQLDLDIEFIKLIYPSNISSPEEKSGRYNALIEFYQQGTAEPYLSPNENQLKLQRLEAERDNLCRLNFSRIHQAEQTESLGYELVDQKKYQQAYVEFSKVMFFPSTLHNIGWLYDKGKLSDLPNYEEAAKNYLKAATVGSFCNLGQLYKNGRIGVVNGEPDFKKALWYLTKSGHSVALSNIGIMYRDGDIGVLPNGEHDYQTAYKYFERTGRAEDLVRIGELYQYGHISLGIPDYQKAIEYCKKAIKNDKKNAKAHAKLGYLFAVHGENGSTPNYQEAEKHLKESICLGGGGQEDLANSYYNLGVLYVNINKYIEALDCYKKSKSSNSLFNAGLLYDNGKVGIKNGKPDYQKAYFYFQQSNEVKAKLEMLVYHQFNYVKKESIEEIVQEINSRLADLPDDQVFYIKGIAEYYLGQWEESLISLKCALAFGSEERELISIIEQLENYFEEPEVSEEKVEPEQEKHAIAPEEKPTQKSYEAASSVLSTPDISFSIDEIVKPEISSCAYKLSTKQTKIFKRKNNIQHKLQHLDSDQISRKPIAPKLQFTFMNREVNEDYENYLREYPKLGELIEDIKRCPWATTGSGKPEVLKGSQYKGCFSRRINAKDRLVYKIIGKGEVQIISVKGHYQKN